MLRGYQPIERANWRTASVNASGYSRLQRWVPFGMIWSRAEPFHTFGDGDVLFATTTGEVENPLLNLTDLGVLASEIAWDAVLSCFPRYEAPGKK